MQYQSLTMLFLLPIVKLCVLRLHLASYLTTFMRLHYNYVHIFLTINIQAHNPCQFMFDMQTDLCSLSVCFLNRGISS
jgi:hypothetical protein